MVWLFALSFQITCWFLPPKTASAVDPTPQSWVGVSGHCHGWAEAKALLLLRCQGGPSVWSHKPNTADSSVISSEVDFPSQT